MPKSEFEKSLIAATRVYEGESGDVSLWRTPLYMAGLAGIAVAELVKGVFSADTNTAPSPVPVPRQALPPVHQGNLYAE